MLLYRENIKKGLIEFICALGCTATEQDDSLFQEAFNI